MPDFSLRRGGLNRWFGAALFVACAALIFWAGLPAHADPLQDMPGRWSGWGSVKMSNGSDERVKCVATYFIRDGGSAIDQNLRCASPDYKIDAKAHFKVNGSRVVGEWEERTHSAKGQVAGTKTDNGFELAVQGDTFTARLIMTSSACKQSINIRPTGLNITQVAIGLRKC